jgi:large subunit ribosomal protein L10e
MAQSGSQSEEGHRQLKYTPVLGDPPMARKPNSMYREIRGQAYTRKEYMGGTPPVMIAQFEVGDRQTAFPVRVHLVIKEQCQIRNKALEAARVSANRFLQKKLGNAFKLKLLVFPHNILRENKVATGAGADRISDGMRGAFGVPVGMAARVHPGQRVITIYTYKEHIASAKEALRKAGVKLPSPHRVEIEHTK